MKDLMLMLDRIRGETVKNLMLMLDRIRGEQ